MLRAGVVAYLVFAMSAAPAICCCTMDSVVAFYIHRLSAGSSAHQHQPSHGGCCSRHGEHPAPVPQAPGEPARQNHNCPCEANRHSILYLSQTKSVPSGVAERLTLPDTTGVPQLLLQSVSPVLAAGSPRQSIAHPFGGPREILRALHILRC
jgi:hypothetical protein